MASSATLAIGKRIKDIRKALGPWTGKLLPRTQLAGRLGVDESTVKKWETGEISISSENAVKLAALASCDVDWVLTGRGRGPGKVGQGGAGNREAPLPYAPAAAVASKLDRQPSELLALLEGLPPEMQRQAIVRAFQRGLDSQELYGAGLLRATVAICLELRRLGFSRVAEEIEAEVGRAVMQEAAKRGPKLEEGG